ncbi:MAG: Mu transposase domain-containing protein [Candidatus Dormibacteria bacterium]
MGARFAEERVLLGPLPQRPFLACTRHPVQASQQALCSFEGSRYSVPLRFAGSKLWLRAFAERVEIWNATSCVANWPRALVKGTLYADFWHFVPALVPQARRISPGHPGAPGYLPARGAGNPERPGEPPQARPAPRSPRVPDHLHPAPSRRAADRCCT